MSRPVVCRCGNRVKVKILHDQWFLKYSDPGLEAAGQRPLKGHGARAPRGPGRVRPHRRLAQGLGLHPACRPWHAVPVGHHASCIEPLSDSTVYMAYYTIAHKIREIDSKLLTPEVFDYIFLGKKSPDLPEKKKLDAMREEFLYWYPYDFRFSAKDLISNHLTFQIFHHVTIFPEGQTPEGHGRLRHGPPERREDVVVEGERLPARRCGEEFGADTVRMFLMGSAEPWQDFDWRNELVLSTKKQIERFYNTVDGDQGRTRRAARHRPLADQPAPVAHRQDHRGARKLPDPAGTAGSLLRDRDRPEVVPPPAPEDCDGSRELAHALLGLGPAPLPVHPVHRQNTSGRNCGSKDLVSFAPWPVADEKLVNEKIELAEELLARTVEDIESIRKLIQITPKSITIALAPAWKHEVFRTIAQSTDRNTVIKEIMKDDEMKKRGKEATDAAKQCTTLIHRLPPHVVEPLAREPINERAVFEAAQAFLEQEFGVPVHIAEAESSGHVKGATALPFKPAIMIE